MADMNKPGDKDNTSETARASGNIARQRWSLTTGFFAVMGGFKIRVPYEYGSALEGRNTLTPYGVLLMTHANLIPDVGHLNETIEDKTKADSFAKGLVCIQAGWMVIQTIARKVSGLPITLLELNTLAHVTCALFMYIVWWCKPQNVNVPETIDIDGDLATLMMMASRTWHDMGSRDQLRSLAPATPRLSTTKGDPRQSSTIYMHGTNEINPYLRNHVIETARGNDDANRSGHKIMGYVDDANSYTIDNINECMVDGGAVILFPGQWLEGIPFTPSERKPIHLTGQSIEQMARISVKWTDPQNAQYVDYLRKDWGPGSGTRTYLAKVASNIETYGDLKGREMPELILLLGLCLLYGGIHATSWNGHFPTDIERSMWRVSSCLVAGTGVAFWLPWALLSVQEGVGAILAGWLMERGWGKVDDTFIYFLSLFVNAVAILMLLVYSFARLFLVTEAFISIRSLPVGAYDTVSWVNVLPHVG
jgi:hypothetical protein